MRNHDLGRLLVIESNPEARNHHAVNLIHVFFYIFICFYV